jgi:para-nitrobenzyl esterase
MKAVHHQSPILGRLAGLFLTVAAASLFASPSAPEVRANGELLTGAWVDAPVPVARFSGIPFARPPVGELRWRAPRPHIPRQGKQQATGFAPACMQDERMVDWYADVAGAFGHGPEVVKGPADVSEDCLHLNVWTPDISVDARLPVMVFVHGGSNKGGWSYEPNYIGQNLAAKGVVVVTITYRLGPFGFFSHRALDNGEGKPLANFALLDIRAAFRWVQQNIGFFGGDPANITGFGESSGAFDLADLLLADLDRGTGGQSLFRRLILQSIGGPARIRRTLAEEQAIGDVLAEKMGLGHEVTAQQLRQVSAEKVLNAASQLPAGHDYSAAIDGKSVFRQPQEVLDRLDAARVDLIVGTNADEWLMYLAEETTPDDIEHWMTENAPEQRQALWDLIADEQGPRRALDRLATASRMLCPSRDLAARVNDSGGRAWVYYFDRQRPGAGGRRLGAYHGAELPYVFDRHDDWLTTDDKDRALSAAIMDYWVRFAATGNPNGAESVNWPAYSGKSPEILVLGDSIGTAPDDSLSLCKMLGYGPWRQGVKE